jgi:4-amino-4-deoxy-L-arabinose transferase-like glycosyltransferase
MQFFLGLGSLPLLGPDEPRYAEVAREMFASDNYVSPFLAENCGLKSPALLYWLQAASYHLFGVGEFAARFPSALIALGTVLCSILRCGAPFPGDWGCYRHWC